MLMWHIIHFFIISGTTVVILATRAVSVALEALEHHTGMLLLGEGGSYWIILLLGCIWIVCDLFIDEDGCLCLLKVFIVFTKHLLLVYIRSYRSALLLNNSWISEGQNISTTLMLLLLVLRRRHNCTIHAVHVACQIVIWNLVRVLTACWMNRLLHQILQTTGLL